MISPLRIVLVFLLFSIPLWTWWILTIESLQRAHEGIINVSVDAWRVSLLCHVLFLILVLPSVIRGVLSQQLLFLLVLNLLPIPAWLCFYLAGAIDWQMIYIATAWFILFSTVLWGAGTVIYLQPVVTENRGVVWGVAQATAIVLALLYGERLMIFVGIW